MSLAIPAALTSGAVHEPEPSPLERVLQQPFNLGLFLPIQNGGWSISTLPRSTDWRFDYNARLTLKAEELGFDLVFGLAQWMPKGGYGGVSNYRETSLDSFISTAALSAITRRILLISTIHVLYGPWHPLHLAKFGATLDHISGGRWGVNLVTGHIAAEARMFGQVREEHDARYGRAAEFVDILDRLWRTEGNVTFEGRHWQLYDAYVSPRPLHGRPILINATGSKAGFEFGARYSDFVFIPSPTGVELEPTLQALPDFTAGLREAAQAQGRAVRTIINPTVVSAATDALAQERYERILASEDTEAVANFNARFNTQTGASDARAWSSHRRRAGERAVGGNIHLVGSPQRIVDDMIRLRDAGCHGVQLTFFDFEQDLAHFGQHILPLMREAGLRL
ncbi:LLM class flavin-dependent oxidoreductase [Xylophilus sp.]|uniref:LLM class flavin-dependent oxidoreductase n=1 Tax=Xylophilus sp. TaxID=2653893 RepID=UPI0013BD61C9|nr:LLM class flavin-dependent oxidoreductase [Xylophilus sp.]KAF1044494.1 MAG: Pyrimidine monooxygenase RutA [Xylophilus sp.]